MVINMMDKKRIMLVVPMLHQGGFERICVLTARLLKDTHDVYVVVFSTKDIFYDVEGLQVIDMNLGAAVSTVKRIINIPKRITALKKLKKKYDIEYTYSFGTTANIVNVLAKYKDVTWAGIRGYGTLQDKGFKLICKKADCVVSCTKVMEDDINNMCKTKASATIYNPCSVLQIQGMMNEELEDEALENFMSSSAKVIVTMGREDDYKGFWHLLKSFYLLKQKVTAVKLVIIGEGEYLEYKKLADDLSISQDVFFTGVKKNPFAILKRSDVYVLTSENEGFPNALVEAMAVGLPCISVNCKTGPAEILNDDFRACQDQTKLYMGDYGIITPIFVGTKNLQADMITPEEKIFAEQMEKLLTDETLMKHYHEKSLKRAQDFSMETYVEQIEHLMMKQE